VMERSRAAAPRNWPAWCCAKMPRRCTGCEKAIQSSVFQEMGDTSRVRLVGRPELGRGGRGWPVPTSGCTATARKAVHNRVGVVVGCPQGVQVI
jgi:hypothetical protein